MELLQLHQMEQTLKQKVRNNMTITIDRIEGNYLIVELENGKIINLPKELIPNAKENDIYSINLNKDEMKKRKNNINNLINDLFID